MAKQQQRKRAGHGEGSVYQRKDGRWVGEITLDDGSRKPYYGKTRKEAYEKKEKALQEQRQGILATGPQQTLKQYLEDWLENVHRPTIRIGTYLGHRNLISNHILPTLGHIRLQKLTSQQINALCMGKLKEGRLSPGVIRVMHGILHNALANAVTWNLIPRNVCESVTPPRLKRHEIQALTKEQTQMLLGAAKGHRLEGLLIVALTTGMRRGELLGLRWQDIDFDNGSLQIRRTVSLLPGHGYVENEPKTVSSRRRVVLPHFALEALKQHCTYQEEARGKAGDKWEEHGLVFCNGYGRFLNPSQLYRMFQALLKHAGLPHMRFHDLRHSAATFMLSMGVHPKVVQELSGHSTISMTMNTYSHVLPSMQKEAMNKIDDLFQGFS